MTDVRLNVYDLLDINRHTACVGLGVFHSGVEVYGREYAYGGHEFSTSGVFETPPRMVPGGARFRESLAVGSTTLTSAEVEELLKRLSREYLGDRYHLLYRNCNHFCEDLCAQLTGRRPPSWINRLAHVARFLNTFTPCILPARRVPRGTRDARCSRIQPIRAIARSPSVPVLSGRTGDTVPLLAGQPGTNGGTITAAKTPITATLTGGGGPPRTSSMDRSAHA